MIIVTEKTKNMKTGEKTKTKRILWYGKDALDAFVEWSENHASSATDVSTTTWDGKVKIGFQIMIDEMKYTITFDFKENE